MSQAGSMDLFTRDRWIVIDGSKKIDPSITSKQIHRSRLTHRHLSHELQLHGELVHEKRSNRKTTLQPPIIMHNKVDRSYLSTRRTNSSLVTLSTGG